MKVFPWMQKFVSCVVSFAVFAQAQSPPKSHPASFAVSVAVLNSAVDNTHCETGKELHARVISPLRIGDKDAPSESFLRGNYVFCNRDARGRLRIAGIKFSTLVLSDGQVVPIEAVLQALGRELPTVGPGTIDITVEDRGTGSSRTALMPSSADLGRLSAASTGVVGLRKVQFENHVMDVGTCWILWSTGDELRVPESAQVVVRLRTGVQAGRAGQTGGVNTTSQPK